MYSKYDFNFESFVIYLLMGQFYMKPECCVTLLHLSFIYENVACVCSLDAGVHPRTHAHTRTAACIQPLYSSEGGQMI